MRIIMYAFWATILGTTSIHATKIMPAETMETQTMPIPMDKAFPRKRDPFLDPNKDDSGSETEYEDEEKELPPSPTKRKPQRMPTPSTEQEEVSFTARAEWFNSLSKTQKVSYFSPCNLIDSSTLLKMCPKIKKELEHYREQHPDALNWWKGMPKIFGAQCFNIRFTILISHPKVLIPLCKEESDVVRNDIIKEIFKFDMLAATAKEGFEIRIDGVDRLELDERTVQRIKEIEEIIKADYKTRCTSTEEGLENEESTTLPPAEKRAKLSTEHRNHVPLTLPDKKEDEDSVTESEQTEKQDGEASSDDEATNLLLRFTTETTSKKSPPSKQQNRRGKRRKPKHVSQ